MVEIREECKLKLIRVRNPWGASHSGWFGTFHDGDEKWNSYKGLREKLPEQEGTFWVKFEDWVLNFNKVYVCRKFGPEWNFYSMEGIFSPIVSMSLAQDIPQG